MRVKPAPDRAVRDPVTMQLLPADGRDVPKNQFWIRRLRDADVVVEAETEAEAARPTHAHADAARNGPPHPRRGGPEG
jgi:hypothetical protein